MDEEPRRCWKPPGKRDVVWPQGGREAVIRGPGQPGPWAEMWTGPVGCGALMAQLPPVALVERCLREAWGETQAHCLQPLPAPRATSPAMLGRIVCPGTWNVQPRVRGPGLELRRVLRLGWGRAQGALDPEPSGAFRKQRRASEMRMEGGRAWPRRGARDWAPGEWRKAEGLRGALAAGASGAHSWPSLSIHTLG